LRKDGEQLALQFFRVEVGDVFTLVVSLVDDDAVLVELRVQRLVEFDDPRDRRGRPAGPRRPPVASPTFLRLAASQSR
jgi:hypothetical protein